MCWSFATILIILFCPAIWTTEIYSLSLHDALPIYDPVAGVAALAAAVVAGAAAGFRLRAPVAAGLSRAGGGHRPARTRARRLADALAGARPPGHPEHPATGREHAAGLAHSADADGGEPGAAGGRAAVPRRASVFAAAALGSVRRRGAEFSGICDCPPARAQLAGVRAARPVAAGDGAGLAAPAFGLDLAGRDGTRGEQRTGHGGVVPGGSRRLTRDQSANLRSACAVSNNGRPITPE